MDDSASVRVAETGRIYTISAETRRRIKVHRDMELVRKLLFAIEAKADLDYVEIRLEGEDDLRVGRHIELLYEAGMIDGVRSDVIGAFYADIAVRDLSWDGHDLAGALRNEVVWDSSRARYRRATLPRFRYR